MSKGEREVGLVHGMLFIGTREELDALRREPISDHIASDGMTPEQYEAALMKAIEEFRAKASGCMPDPMHQVGDVIYTTCLAYPRWWMRAPAWVRRLVPEILRPRPRRVSGFHACVGRCSTGEA
jgi:hypothetical protein